MNCLLNEWRLWDITFSHSFKKKKKVFYNLLPQHWTGTEKIVSWGVFVYECGFFGLFLLPIVHSWLMIRDKRNHSRQQWLLTRPSIPSVGTFSGQIQIRRHSTALILTGFALTCTMSAVSVLILNATSKEINEFCVCVFSPINSFVVVIGIEELDLLICLWTWEVTGDGGMHE